MNSKEALNNIKKLFIGSPINPTQQFEIIEKDLEVLDILKRKNIEMELLKNCIKLPDGIIRYNKIWAVSDNCLIIYRDKYLEYDEYKKLKEWLENGKINN